MSVGAGAETGAARRAGSCAGVRVRLARDDDAAGILSVYAPFIDTPVTFEEEVPSIEAFRARVRDVRACFPYLVAEAGLPGEPRIVGYAYAHAQHPRAAYRWNVELSVYLAPEAQGRGRGTALYRTLLALLTAQGILAAYALVTLPNAASERLHERFGFARMGVQPHAGYTCGAWREVAWYVKELGTHTGCPAEPISFPQLEAARPEFVARVLTQVNASRETS